MKTDKTTIIRGYAKRLRLSGLTANVQDILFKAQKESPSYDDFLSRVLEMEIRGREERQKISRLKAARLPLAHDLDLYDHGMSNGLGTTQLNQLRSAVASTSSSSERAHSAGDLLVVIINDVDSYMLFIKTKRRLPSSRLTGMFLSLIHI